MTWLDVDTGELRLDGLTLSLRPWLRRSVAMAHPDWSHFTAFTEFPPHLSRQFRAGIDGTEFVGVVHFAGERLASVSLTIADPTVSGSSWADLDVERARRGHDAWLRERLGRGRPWQRAFWPFGGVEHDYHWGSVGSYVHPQDSTPSIVVSYAESASTWLDRGTGALRFDDLGLVLAPGTTRSRALEHPDAQRFATWATGEPGLTLRGVAAVDGTPFTVLPHFDGERLHRVRLVVADEAIAGTSWRAYDPERLRRFHDDWLRSRLGEGGEERNAGSWPHGSLSYSHGWGSIASTCPAQDLSATITASYH